MITTALLTAWACGEPQPAPRPEQSVEDLPPPVEDSPPPPAPAVDEAPLSIDVLSFEVAGSTHLSTHLLLRVDMARHASSPLSSLVIMAACKMGEKHMWFHSPRVDVGNYLPVGKRRIQGIALFESVYCRIPSQYEHCDIELWLDGDETDPMKFAHYCARNGDVKLGECGELPPPVVDEHRYDAFEAVTVQARPGAWWIYWCADLRLGSAPRETHEVAARCQLEGKRKPFTDVVRLPGGRRATNGETVKQQAVFYELAAEPRACEFVLRRAQDDQPLADIPRLCLADEGTELRPCP